MFKITLVMSLLFLASFAQADDSHIAGIYKLKMSRGPHSKMSVCPEIIVVRVNADNTLAEMIDYRSSEVLRKWTNVSRFAASSVTPENFNGVVDVERAEGVYTFWWDTNRLVYEDKLRMGYNRKATIVHEELDVYNSVFCDYGRVTE